MGESILLIGVEPQETYRLLLANDAFWQDTGHQRDQIGKSIEEIVDAESYGLLKRRYKKVITSKRATEYTEWYTVPAGRQAYEVKLAPILNAVGECVQIAAITRNVTELYNLRTQVQDLRRRLYTSKNH